MHHVFKFITGRKIKTLKLAELICGPLKPKNMTPAWAGAWAGCPLVGLPTLLDPFAALPQLGCLFELAPFSLLPASLSSPISSLSPASLENESSVHG